MKCPYCGGHMVPVETVVLSARYQGPACPAYVCTAKTNVSGASCGSTALK